MNNITFIEAWSGKADCINCGIRQSVLFANLNEKDFESLHRPVDQFTFKEGELIYTEGDPGKYIYTIRQGLLKLVQYLPDGTQRIVRLVQATDVTGLEVMVSQTYTHNAICLQTTELCRIPIEDVKLIAKQNACLVNELMKRWQDAVTSAEHVVREFSTGSAKQKVARLMLWLARKNPENECKLFGREDLGALLGITTETASRIVADFKRTGKIKEVNSNHFICNIDLLESLLPH